MLGIGILIKDHQNKIKASHEEQNNYLSLTKSSVYKLLNLCSFPKQILWLSSMLKRNGGRLPFTNNEVVFNLKKQIEVVFHLKILRLSSI